MKKNIKKPAIDLTDLAIGVVVLGIAVTIGALVLSGVRDGRLTDLDVVTTTNETLGTVNTATTDSFANVWFKDLNECISNATAYGDGMTLDSGNYTLGTVHPDTGSQNILLSTIGGDTTLNNSDWNCTYTWYNTSRADFSTANEAVLGLAEYGNWFKIIVIVGVAAVVLSLIFMAFGGRSSSAGQGVSY